MSDAVAWSVRSAGPRLDSLDVLRGFDMFLIMGFSAVVFALAKVFGWSSDCWLVTQFQHVEWDGLRLEDTIFPLFLFLAGVSWPFSCAKQRENGRTTGEIVRRCLKRAATLFVLGLVYNGLLDGQLRMGSVLGRIGVAWAAGAILFMAASRRVLAVLAFAIPTAYWMLLYFVPAPDAATLAVPEKLAYVVQDWGRGPFSIVGNLSGWVDRRFMPGILSPYAGIADNQSALGYIPAIGTALFGILAGDFILRTRETVSGVRRVLTLFLAAAVLTGAGLVVAKCFGAMSAPVNKKLWSASFTFVVGGYSFAMLALAHGLVDVCGIRKGTFFFKVIGMNSITIYLAQRFIPFDVVAQRLFGGLAAQLSVSGGRLLLACGVLAIEWLFLLFLYRKGVFLKV